MTGSAVLPIPTATDTNTTYTTNTLHQLVSSTGPNRTFTYDADGNLTGGYTKDGYPFVATYDAENRMTALTYTGAGNVVYTTTYVYSGDGFMGIERKYENTVLTQETRFVRDGGLVVQDRNGSNGVTREYTWGLNLGGGIGGLLNLKSAGQHYAYLYDGSGNVEALINSAQSVVAAYRYDPFGNLTAKTGSLTQPYGFSTKRYDAALGMIHYEARNYWPARGTWDSRDPLGETGGLNLYAFVGNNPVNWIDPWGESATVGATAGTLVCGPPCAVAGALIGLGVGGIIGIAIVDAIHDDAACESPAIPDTNNNNRCQELINEMRDYVNALIVKDTNLMLDPYNLYQLAYSTNPGGALAGYGTWVGHIGYYRSLQTRLQILVRQAEALGCQVPPEVYMWMNMPPPLSPGQ